MGDIVVTMDFDRMGSRTFYKEEVNGVVTKHHRFVYDNYLCVQKVDALNNNSQINLFVWDPTEPVATRPLFTQRGTGYKFFYTCDGNKNVSEFVHFEQRNGIAAHYDYAPFGAVTRAISVSAVTDNTFTTDNPFRFSSEYHDDTLGLVYYNYRHYNPMDGRWVSKDPLGEKGGINCYVNNLSIQNGIDFLGLAYFALRPLEKISRFGVFWVNPVTDFLNIEVAHEQVFFEDGKEPSNIGFFYDGLVRADNVSLNYTITKRGFNDCVMRLAVKLVAPKPYALMGFIGIGKYNCQNYAEDLRLVYAELVYTSESVRCLCNVTMDEIESAL